jgi:hypothetical protein
MMMGRHSDERGLGAIQEIVPFFSVMPARAKPDDNFEQMKTGIKVLKHKTSQPVFMSTTEVQDGVRKHTF